ncbi:hypothetical protein D3C72_2421510 [compost metagenome]
MNDCNDVPPASSVPAPRRVPAGRSTAWFSTVPAAYSNWPVASRTSPDSTVPLARDSSWSSAASTGKRVPAASFTAFRGKG